MDSHPWKWNQGKQLIGTRTSLKAKKLQNQKMKDVDEVDGDGGDGGDGGGVGADVGGDQLILSCLRGFAL